MFNELVFGGAAQPRKDHLCLKWQSACTILEKMPGLNQLFCHWVLKSFRDMEWPKLLPA